MSTLPNLIDGSEIPAAAVYLTQIDLMWICQMVKPSDFQRALPPNGDNLRMLAFSNALHARLRSALLTSFDLNTLDPEKEA